MMATWELKTWPEYFQAVKSGKKTFEARVCEDKNFAVGDKLVLREFVRGVGYTGEVLSVTVTYVLPGGEFGIERGYCVMSIVPDIEEQKCDCGGTLRRVSYEAAHNKCDRCGRLIRIRNEQQ